MAYHYTDCGLDNVWLVNGYTVRNSKYGRAVSIKDLKGLHDFIAEQLVIRKTPLLPQEFRFLRKELELSQKRLAELIRIGEQTVANWEKGNTTIPGTADALLRALCQEKLKGNSVVSELLNAMHQADRDEYNHKIELSFSEKKKHWQAVA